MAFLPDLLAPDLDLVVVGTAAGRTSALRQCYYAGRGNRFWRTLREVGLTPKELRPDDYPQLLNYGIGLTDLAKGADGADTDLTAEDFDRLRLRSVIAAISPHFVAFNGKAAAAHFFTTTTKEISYGQQPTAIGLTIVYACPSTSAANGHWSRAPWEDLARAVEQRAQ
jgi:double-stranded uracil-DNA glycosylase